MVSEAISNFENEVARSLKSGVNRRCSFSVLFRTDVFKFLFGGKGNDCPHKLGKNYNLEDFDGALFSPEWYRCYDRLGDGCTVQFPMRMYSRILWSPVAYLKGVDDVVTPKKRSFKEICNVWISKTRC